MRFITFALLGLGLVCADASAQTQKSIGQITAAFGEAKIESSGSTRNTNVFSTFNNDECVRTKDAGLSLVLRTRLVVKFDAETCVRFSEGVGQTSLQLENGTVQVFAGKRAADMGDAGVQDALARVDGKDAVFLASYDRAARSGYYACEHGTVNIELATDHRRVTLNADQQAIAAEGKPLEIAALDRAVYNRHQRTLLRLGQSVIEQGSQTQRGRSSALDTRNALAQLEAAGWIDRTTLAVVRPLAQTSGSNSEPAKTTDNQVASSSGASSSSPPPIVSSPAEPSAEAPPPRETPSSSPPDINIDPVSDSHDSDNNADALRPAKIVISGTEKSSDPPKIKVPKIDTTVRDDGDHELKIPKPEKVARADNQDDGGPDLKIPKVEKVDRSDNSDLKDIKEVTKQVREKVEKNDKHGKHGKDD